MKRQIFNNLKNLIGWRSARKIVVLAVDDYGNVRIDSKSALQNMSKAGIKPLSRFDALDTLETREDLEALYEVLSSVKDKNGNSAIFTPYVLTANCDFEKMESEGFESYHYELLPKTYSKLAHMHPKAYSYTWELWKEGIEKGLMKPQFHGREHFNLLLIEKKLREKDPELLISLKNRSLASLSVSNGSNSNWTASFSFWDVNEDTKKFPEIIQTGLNDFLEVYGYRSTAFTPSAQQFPRFLEKELSKFGILSFDKPFYQNRHINKNEYRKEVSFTGYQEKTDIVNLVRNVVFEPTHGNKNWVDLTMQEIASAFRWNRPAIISSHRVNFCGYIDEKNRKSGLNSLKSLLQKIVKKWPEVEFMAANELGDLIALEQRNNVQ